MKDHTPFEGALRALFIAAIASPALAQAEWRRYRPTTTGILGDYVQTIFIDDQDRPWIGAYTPFWEEGGMSRGNADGTWEVLSSFDHSVITSPRFNDIVRDAAGVLWIAGSGGLLRYDPAAGPSSLVRYDSNNTPIPGKGIVDLDIAPDGTIWLAVYTASSPLLGGLVRHTPSTGSWQVWTTANGLPWGGGWPGWNGIEHVAVRPDVGGGGGYTVWFNSGYSLGMGTWRNGTFTWLGNPQSPPPGLYPIKFLSDDPIDDQSNLWVRTNQGLMREDASGNQLIVGYPAGLSTEVSVVVALSGGRAVLGTYYADVFMWNGGWSWLGNWGSKNHTYTFVEDSTGALWAGGIGGAAKYTGGSWQRYRLTNTGMVGFWVRAIDFAPDGRVFMNGNAGPGVGGFDVFDGQRWTNANSATYGLGYTWGLPSDNVEALCYRANGNLAIAPSGLQGLVEWDGSTYTYLIPKGLDFVEVDEDSLGRLWAVRNVGAGITRITGTQQVTYNSSNSPLSGAQIESVELDPAAPGFIWISERFAVHRTDGDTWTSYPRALLGLTKNTSSELLSASAPHPDGTVWIGSHNGLYHFDPATSQYTRYHPGNSALPSNDIYHVHVAPDGTVWAASFDSAFPYPGGLTHFEGASSTHYSSGNSPLPHNQIWELASRVVAGGYELWVGTASEAVAVITVASGFESFCFGDGTGTPCPCGNAGAPGHGCENSFATGGALLTASGSAQVSNDTLLLSGLGMPPTGFALYFQGDSQIAGGAGLPFGDGLRCVGGTTIRLGTKTSIGGASSYGGPAGDTPVSVMGMIPAAGGTRHYQIWYRNNAAFCTPSTFNLSNALTIEWFP